MLTLTELVASCAICGSSKADNDFAFALTALALASVPLVLLAIGVVLVVRAHRRAADEP